MQVNLPVDGLVSAAAKLKVPALVLAGALAAAALLGHLHVPIPHWPTPVPTPVPTPTPTPTPPPPKAIVGGFFWPGPPDPVLSSGDDPAPLGLFALDATSSVSDRPIRWKVRGPAGSAMKLRTYSPDGAPGASIAEGYPTLPGTYHFDAVAIGTAGGQLDADADTASFTVEAPPTPTPPTPTPTPTPPAPPTPTPTPTPPTPTPPAPTPTPPAPPNPPAPPGPPPLPGPGPAPGPGPKPFPRTSIDPGGLNVGSR